VEKSNVREKEQETNHNRNNYKMNHTFKKTQFRIKMSENTNMMVTAYRFRTENPVPESNRKREKN